MVWSSEMEVGGSLVGVVRCPPEWVAGSLLGEVEKGCSGVG